jgi:hypothetical protein
VAGVWRCLVPTGRGTTVLFAGIYVCSLLVTFCPWVFEFLSLSFVVWLLPVFHPIWRVSVLTFLAGMLCWRYREQLRFEARWLVIAIAVLITGIWLRQWHLVMPLALPYVVLFLGARLPFQKWIGTAIFPTASTSSRFLSSNCSRTGECRAPGFRSFSRPHSCSALPLALSVGFAWKSQRFSWGEGLVRGARLFLSFPKLRSALGTLSPGGTWLGRGVRGIEVRSARFEVRASSFALRPPALSSS